MSNILYVKTEEERLIIRIFELHQITKTYYLKCEEYSEDLDSILQPIKEFRDAYDHFIRYLNPNESSEYKIKNLDKALGHEYRAFFDTMDYFCLVMRERIYKLKSGFSTKELEERIPNYCKYQQRLLICCSDIADLRKKKDIMRVETTVEEYQRVALELEQICNYICHYLAEK